MRNARSIKEKRILMRHVLWRWASFFASLLAVWAFVFVVAPAFKKIPAVGSMAGFIDDSGIRATALYYTSVEETATSEMYLHNAMVYKPKEDSGRVPSEGNRGTDSALCR
jgi:hypothetical protein